MNKPDQKTIAYLAALLMPPLGVYLGTGLKSYHFWISVFLSAASYPLGLAYAILVIAAQTLPVAEQGAGG